MSMVHFRDFGPLGALPPATDQAAASVSIAIDDNQFGVAAEILRKFGPVDRIAVAMKAIELGIDPARMERAMLLANEPTKSPPIPTTMTPPIVVTMLPPPAATSQVCWPHCAGGIFQVTPTVNVKLIVLVLAAFGLWRWYSKRNP
jgi:hypothetical protein